MKIVNPIGFFWGKPPFVTVKTTTILSDPAGRDHTLGALEHVARPGDSTAAGRDVWRFPAGHGVTPLDHWMVGPYFRDPPHVFQPGTESRG